MAIINELKQLILYHENNLFYHRHHMSPSVQHLEELTVKYLKELEKLKEESNGKSSG